MTTSEPLRGKTVVRTGASSGIGAKAARLLAGLGATVAVVGRVALSSPRRGAEPLLSLATRDDPVTNADPVPWR